MARGSKAKAEISLSGMNTICIYNNELEACIVLSSSRARISVVADRVAKAELKKTCALEEISVPPLNPVKRGCLVRSEKTCPAHYQCTQASSVHATILTESSNTATARFADGQIEVGRKQVLDEIRPV